MVEVPGVGGQAAVDRVYDGILDNVHRAGHAAGEERLRPARQPVGLHQQASGEKTVIRCHLSVDNVLCKDVGADKCIKS